MPEYNIRFDFQGGIMEGGVYVPDPPSVMITGDGADILRVYEEPIPKETPPTKDTEWEAGPFAQTVLALLREAAKRTQAIQNFHATNSLIPMEEENSE